MLKEKFSNLKVKTKERFSWINRNKFNLLLYILYTIPFLMLASGDIGYAVLISAGIMSARLIKRDKLNHYGIVVVSNIAFLICSFIALALGGYGLLFSMLGLHFCNAIWKILTTDKKRYIDTIIAPACALFIFEMLSAHSFSWFNLLLTTTLNQNAFTHIAFIAEFTVFYLILRTIKSILEENKLTYFIYSCVVFLLTAIINIFFIHSISAFLISILLMLVNIIYIIFRYKKLTPTLLTPQNIRIKDCLFWFLIAFLATGAFGITSALVVESSADLYGSLGYAFSTIIK